MTTALPTEPVTAKRTLIIDCDIHENVRSLEQIRPYLAKEFQSYLRFHPGNPIVHPFPHATRQDAIRPDGTLESGYLDGLQAQHLDANGITFGILTGIWSVNLGALPQRFMAAAFASAYNDWLIAEWLEPEPRLKGSVTVSPQLAKAAAAEIDRVGGHPGMVQVLLPASSPDLPYGNDIFDPIWEAAVRNDLVVAMHVAGVGGLFGQGTAAGFPASYMESRCQYPNMFEAQLISLVANGVFEKFPELRVVMVEGGFAWVPAVMWRMDQTWRSMRLETPWLKRRPSEYIRERVRFSTQPFEEPDDPAHILQVIDMMGSESMLLFATDYPHWDFDDPKRALPRTLSEELKHKILWQNAADFYGISEPPA